MGSPILCQHGDQECQEDTIEGCAFAVADTQIDALNFLFCFEGDNQSDLSSVKKCATSSKVDYQKLQKCSSSSSEQGKKIDIENAIATTKLGSSKLGTPWVLINGIYVQNPMQLLEAVCTAIKGDQPAGCAVSV